MRLPIAAVLSLGFLPPALLAADWPTYRHDQQRTGSSTEQLDLTTLQESWRYQSAHPPQPAWPGPAKWDAYAKIRGLRAMRNYDEAFQIAVVGQSLYFGSSVDDSLHSLSTRDGSERWIYTTDAPIRIAPCVVDERVYFGADDGYAYCLDAHAGQLVWRFKPSPDQHQILHNGRFISSWPCRSGVIVANGTAWFTAALFPWSTSYLCSVDARTGQQTQPQHYTRTLSGATLEGAMAVASEMLIAPQGRIAPMIFKTVDGSSIGSLSQGGGSFVTVRNDQSIVHAPGNKTGWITVSDPQSRKKLLTLKDFIALVESEQRSYWLADHRLRAVDRASGNVIWEHSIPHSFEIIMSGSTLFLGGRGQVVGVDAETGETVWTGTVEGRATGLAVADSALFVSTDRGAIHCFRDGAHPAGPDAKEQRSNASSDTAAATAIPSQQPPKPVSSAPAAASSPSKTTRSAALPGTIGHWQFRGGTAALARRRGITNAKHWVPDLAGSADATIQGSPQLWRVGGTEALVFDGAETSVLITADHREVDLPKSAITVEAWVRVDQPLRWGGIIGAMQDNGSDEQGWILGFNDSQFSFAVAGKDGPPRLNYLQASTTFQPRRWYHVVGTYDGSDQMIFVDGVLEATATDQRGAIDYPEKAFYEIGAYHDRDENFRLTGMIDEVRVFDRALTGPEITELFQSRHADFPRPIKLALGPYAQFVGPDSARVKWTTKAASPTRLNYEAYGRLREFFDPTLKQDHEVLITGITHQEVGNYVIQVIENGQAGVTGQFELDAHFNYAVPPVPGQPAATEEPDSPADVDSTFHIAQSLLKHSQIDRGICLLIGCSQPDLGLELARQSSLRVIAIDTRMDRVEQCRAAWRAAGVYGVRAAAHHVTSFAELPFTGEFANLIVAADQNMTRDTSDWSELQRVLRPSGGVAYVRSSTNPELDFRGLKSEELGTPIELTRVDLAGLPWQRIERGALAGAGEWSHLYGTADNSAFGGESLGGASTSGEMRVKWFGKPGPRAQPDRNGRKPSPLSTNGRLFVQGLHRLVALDAYNGTILWSYEIPALERFNMPRDSGNWCADDNFVYVAIRDKCWQIDAATGQLRQAHAVQHPAANNTAYDWGYLGRSANVLLGSGVRAGSAYTNFWGKADSGWYDAASGPATYMVCSDNLFAIRPGSGELAWEYEHGVVINPTITASGNQVYFVECRHPAVLASATRRVGMPELWQDQFLVALDLETGQKQWERPLDTADGIPVFYMAAGSGRLVIVSSNQKKYDVYAYSAADGSDLWHAEFGWPGGKGDHGKAMSRPAIVENTLYVRPKAFDLQTGRLLDFTLPAGGCGTYAATTNAFIFRSSEITMWDRNTGSSTHWDRLRPGCWLSTIPAGGMLLSPEAGGGCSCGNWMETSIGFMPARD